MAQQVQAFLVHPVLLSNLENLVAQELQVVRVVLYPLQVQYELVNIEKVLMDILPMLVLYLDPLVVVLFVGNMTLGLAVDLEDRAGQVSPVFLEFRAYLFRLGVRALLGSRFRHANLGEL